MSWRPPRRLLATDGYVVLRGLLAEAEVDMMAGVATRYLDRGGKKKLDAGNIFGNGVGYHLPDIQGDKGLRAIFDAVHGKPALHRLLQRELGEYRFIGRNELNVDRYVGWHRDGLNGAVGRYQAALDDWSSYMDSQHGNTSYGVVNLAVYLEGHADDTLGLVLRPSSHVSPRAEWGVWTEVSRRRSRAARTSRSPNAEASTVARRCARSRSVPARATPSSSTRTFCTAAATPRANAAAST